MLLRNQAIQVMSLCLILISFVGCGSSGDDGGSTTTTSVDQTSDLDSDGIFDYVDNCPSIRNADQADSDQDSIGDVCDTDLDGDGVPNHIDNCPLVSNSNQLDSNSDGIGDACNAPSFVLDGNTDLDGDGAANDVDNCPSVSNADQADSDNDGIGDACDVPDVVVTPPPPPVDLTPDNTPPILINGYNATVAVHANPGAFVQLNTKDWVETGPGNTRFNFVEQLRDEWSVYLFDSSRSVSIQLDYWRKKIVYSDPSQSFDLYDIISSDPKALNGYNVTRVFYDKPAGSVFKNGGFVQLNSHQWSENNEDGSFIFEEIGRDDWSVFLSDAGRGVGIQLDLSTKEVKYSDANISSALLYAITDPQPEKINAWVMREVINDFASFLQTNAYVWVESKPDGSQYTYSEIGRDEWSSFLYDASRNVYIQLDLHKSKIFYSVGDQSYNLEYLGVIDVAIAPVVIPQAGPIAHYTFNGGTAADASGNGKNLTWEGDIYQVEGKEGEALYLTGNNSAAVLPQGVMNYLHDFTISTFVKAEKLEQWSRIFDFGSGTSNYMFLTPRNGSNDKIRFAIASSGSGEQIIDGEAPLNGSINGHNARVVMHDNKGAFVQLNANQWVENREGTLDSIGFQEVGRDDWSVYLHDASRNVDIQLDLWRKKVVYSDPNNRFDLYNITSANPNEINGYAASRIKYNGGGFYHLNPGKWVEDAGANSFAFNEVARDDWSVYLFDPNRLVSIQLDLWTKQIKYSDASGQSFVLYHITDSRPADAENNWIHVAVTKQGNVGSLYVNGKLVGSNTNMTISPADLGATTQNWIGRSQFSNDPNFIGAIDEFRIYNRALSQHELKEIVGPDPKKITMMGTNISFTPQELKTQLQNSGMTYVDQATYIQNKTLGKNQCTIVYANADRDDISAEVGLLTCNVQTPDGRIKLSTQAVYGGCDVARLDQGVGSSCAVGVASNDLRLTLSENPPVYNDVSVQGPGAHECTAISTENLCMGVGATLASASYGFKNKNGSGLGAGVSVGVGAGFNSSYSEGVFSGSIDLKLGIGLSIEYSIATNDVYEVARLGEAAWVEVNGELVAVGNKSLKAFQDFGNEVQDVGGQVVGGLNVAGNTLISFASDKGQTAIQAVNAFSSAVPSAAQDAATGLVNTAGRVATGVATATNETVTFFGKTATSIGGCVLNPLSCF